MARIPGALSASRPDQDARQRAWQLMRYLTKNQGRFTDGEIISIAEIGVRNLQAYRKRLVEAGYLEVVQKRRSGYRMGDAIYAVVRDTGPKHPLARRNESAMYDQNNGEIYGPTDATGGTEMARRTAAGL